jgi:hypothetical protein
MKNREKKETILNGVERLILGYETLENCNKYLYW